MTDKPDGETIEDLDIEIPDVALDTGDEQQAAPDHAVPAGVKYGLPAFVLVIALMGYFVYQTFTDSSAEEALVFEPEEIIDIASQESPVRLSPSIPDRNLADRASVDSLKEKVRTLEKALSDSSAQFTEQRQAVDHQDNSIQQVLTRLEANSKSMAELAAAINGLSARLDVIEGSVDNNNQRILQLTRRHKRQPRVRPAFNLLSIDQWGGRDSVVLEMQDTTTMAAVGDVRAGWAIQSINRPNCIDVVRLSDKATATVCRKSNS